MKMIGLIGGMSWESSVEYYRILNRGVRDRLGPSVSARCLLWSFDFSEIEQLQHSNDWVGLGQRLADAARHLEAAGADALLICTNTMHRVADDVEQAVSIPLLHIADPTAARIRAEGYRRVGLLGTAFTMEQDFYTGRLRERHGLDVLVPDAPDREAVHRIIYDELVAGRLEPASRAVFREVIGRLITAGAEAVILGCTEIMLLVRPEDSAVPLFDTTEIHAEAAIAVALDQDQNRVSS
ncbi:aspartate/glutamate racemase family protein [Hephaestia mangrovi]|uniref:aspartate/glutamate racemase family protein n=1 Tax=Hephaestia mangrovi TaxID=2873268 RepID=UPI001CA60965|nr:aspartate/glutamate racemase family protein [Hephaestia mangrovi]MBY8826858.1 aspartate/glutamate racemase family protein [Hephaestia mangrovi]